MDLASGGSITSTYYYAEDFLGSSRTMVQHGATSPCFDADFLPFGREKDAVATCTQNDYKFEGKERDTETGNDDFGARYYSSNFGRWLSPDWSSIPAPVPYANLTNPQTLNLYAMVQDNPESSPDLDGHMNTAATASQKVTCDVTDDQGCDYDQVGFLSATERNPDYANYSPDKLASELNDWSKPGEPYALSFTPAAGINVANCLKSLAACQQASQKNGQNTVQMYSIEAHNGTIWLYDKNGNLVGTYQYSTGRNGDTNPADKDNGPLPPGRYTINPSEISEGGFFRTWIDGRDWGGYRVPLHPSSHTDTHGRDGFFLHGGGIRNGSEGCLKVCSVNQDVLFHRLQQSTAPVPVTVY